jgi:hypothetical protein
LGPKLGLRSRFRITLAKSHPIISMNKAAVRFNKTSNIKGALSLIFDNIELIFSIANFSS